MVRFGREKVVQALPFLIYKGRGSIEPRPLYINAYCGPKRTASVLFVRLEQSSSIRPVNHIEKCAYIIRSSVLIIEVIGMLPNV